MRTTGIRACARAAAVAVCAALLGVTGAASAVAAEPRRLAGDDRIGTAVEVSKAAFRDGGSYVAFVASAGSWPDALAAGALAAQYSAPLLLVPAEGKLPAVVTGELERLGVDQVFVLGGLRSVSADVEQQLAGHGAVARFDGDDRYDTAAYAASVLADPGKPLYVASGAGFADALGGGAAAGAVGGALVLTEPGRVPAPLTAELPRLAPSRVVVMGGPGVVSDAVLQQLQQLLPGVPVIRSYGADRYATAAQASADVHPTGNAAGTSAAGTGSAGLGGEVLLASGTSFPDGLAGAAVSGPRGAPLLLTTRDCVPAATLAEVRRLGATEVIVLGGPTVVGPGAAALTPC